MKQIKLKSNGIGRYDDVSPFIITDSKLILQIDLPSYNGEFYLAYGVGGKISNRLLPRSGQIVLENLTAGELNAEVRHCLKGEVVKTYKIEPLLLKELDGAISAIPEFEELNRHICAVERSFKAYKQNAEQAQKTLEDNVFALVRFAYKDYCANVYLNGGSFEKFLKEFCFNLTKEQIEQLKGE